MASPAQQRLTLVGHLGPLEDDIKSTLAAIEGTEAEHHAVVAEQGRVSAVDTRAKEELRMMLLREKPVLASQRAKLARLQTQLADAKEQMKVLNGNENRITQMQREAQILEVSYRKYSEGLEQARLDESLENQRISNINVAQPATLSFQPVKPQRSAFLFAGLFLACFGGPTLAVLFSVYRPVSTAPHGVDHRLDMPALAPAPALRDAQLCRLRVTGRFCDVRRGEIDTLSLEESTHNDQPDSQDAFSFARQRHATATRPSELCDTRNAP